MGIDGGAASGKTIAHRTFAQTEAKRTPSKAATSSPSPARVSTARSSASTTWSLCPTIGEYAPGETVHLQVNTDRAGGTVLLFVRPTGGIYLPPKVIRLDGKSTVEEIGVVEKDMPNFFVEAVTVADGRVYTETKEIVVPPEKRVLNVAIEPSKEAYKPGEKAKVRIKLTDLAGKPFVGSTVVAIYDKSLEYISGGSNVPEIKAFFWKWRRYHHPQTESSLDRWSQNLIPPKTPAMSDLGVFGG